MRSEPLRNLLDQMKGGGVSTTEGWRTIGVATSEASVTHCGREALNVRHEDGGRSTWKCYFCGEVAPFTSPRQARLTDTKPPGWLIEKVVTLPDEPTDRQLAVWIRQSVAILDIDGNIGNSARLAAEQTVTRAALELAERLDPKPVRHVKLNPEAGRKEDGFHATEFGSGLRS